MTLGGATIFVILAMVCFLIAFILDVSGATLAFGVLGWIALGLVSWAASTLVR